MTTNGGIEQGAAPDPDHAGGDPAVPSQAQGPGHALPGDASAAGTQGPFTGRVPESRPSPGFFDWVRRQGIRRGGDRWLGGVASGIANRMGVDPLAVRVVFVVIALFSGLGLFAYGLAWAVLPEDDDRIHAEEVSRGHWSAGMTGAVIMALLGLSDTGLSPIDAPRGYGWFPWPLVWLAAVAAVVYLIINHSRSGTTRSLRPQPRPPAVPRQGAGIPPEGLNPFPATQSHLGYGSGPDPRARQGTSDYPGGPFVAVVSGIAVIVASVTLFLGSTGVTDLGNQAVTVAWAAAAAVLGLGIVVAGITSHRAGILSFLAVAAMVSAVLTLTGGVSNPDNLAVGRTLNWAPESVSQLRDGYTIAAGSGELDLRSLAAASPLPSDITLPVNVAASSVTIFIPADVPVRVNSRMAFGTIQNDDGDSSTGLWSPEQQAYNPEAKGGTLILDLQGAFSTIHLIGPS